MRGTAQYQYILNEAMIHPRVHSFFSLPKADAVFLRRGGMENSGLTESRGNAILKKIMGIIPKEQREKDDTEYFGIFGTNGGASAG